MMHAQAAGFKAAASKEALLQAQLSEAGKAEVAARAAALVTPGGL